MLTMYGIKNCDTIKKARKWLESEGIEYQFHDYRSDGISEAMLTTWVEQLGWQALVNKRSTTWRGLDEETKTTMDAKSALATMLAQPTLIKRPLLDNDSKLLLGFKADRYHAELIG